MKNDKYLLVSMSMGIVLMIFLMLVLMSPVTTVVFSSQNDTFEANVTISNAAPNVSSMYFNDVNTGDTNITLTQESDTNYVECNATITDTNGWQDVATDGGANATIWHRSVNSTGPFCTADNNTCYHNTSCSFSDGSGDTVIAHCGFFLTHEALNGTWTCNLTAWDGAPVYADNITTAEVDQLVALSVEEDSINFGTMDPGENSSSAQSTNVTNQGNVYIDVQLKTFADDMDCSVLGKIGVANISYNSSPGDYLSMFPTYKLSTSLATLDTFNLGIEGYTPFAANENATNNTYWTIGVPHGVRGTCNVTIFVGAVLDPAINI